MKKAELETGLNELKETVNSITGVLGSVVKMLDDMRKNGPVTMPSVPKTTPKMAAPTSKTTEKKASALHLPCTLTLEVNLDSEGEPLLSSSGKSVSFKVPKSAPIATGQTLWIKRESLGETIPSTIALTIK